MRELASIDLRHVVDELTQFLGGRIEKIYSPSAEELVMQLRTPSLRKVLRVVVPKVAYLADWKDEMPERPSAWCSLLRKYIQGAKILFIEQPASERIITIKAGKSGGENTLVLEFFGKGQLLLLDAEGTVIGAYDERDEKDRSIARGKKYELPTSRTIGELSADEFAESLRASEKKNVSSALASMGLGAFYAKEICARTGVDIKAAVPEDVETLRTALHSILSQKSEPGMSDGEPVPFRMNSLGSFEARESFSKALEDSYSEATSGQKEEKATAFIDSKRTRIEKSLAAQESALKKLEKERVECQAVGEHLYANYVKYESLLKEIAAVRKKGKAAVEEVMKSHPEVVNYDPAKGEIEINQE